MTSTTRYGIAALVMVALLAGLRVASAGRGSERQELFRVARSTNRNVVTYAARVASQTGHLDAARPVEAFWLMLAEDGRREELTWLERQVAYGFSAAPFAGGVRLSLSACDERSISVHRVGARYRAEVAIAGRPSYLSRIWVEVSDGLLGPDVRYVQLEGTDVHSGAPLTERIEHRARRNLAGARAR